MAALVKGKMTFDSPQQEAFLNLWRTYDRLKILEEDLFSSVNLSAQQYNTLRLLDQVSDQALTTSELGNQLISRAPDMTRLLDKLERRDLIQRERRDDNRRVVNVSITPAGRSLLKTLQEPVKAVHQEQLGHLTAAELKQLTQLLIKARADR